jgi:hypothetical protein
MGLHPQNIGQTMPHGFAGSYARQPDSVISTRPAGGTEQIPFGAPLKYDAEGRALPMGAGDTAAKFVGVAVREVKSALSYLEQGAGAYAPGEAVPVFQRGAVNAKCWNGAPKLGGPVFVRVTANSSIPTPVGGFETSTGSAPSGTVQLAGCQWAGPADADGVAELRILTMPCA